MEQGAIFEPIAGREISETADGYVIWDAAGEKVHFLNSTAAVVYELCDGKLTVEDIADQIDEAYGLVEPSMSDVQTCLSSLEAEAIVRRLT